MARMQGHNMLLQMSLKPGPFDHRSEALSTVLTGSTYPWICIFIYMLLWCRLRWKDSKDVLNFVGYLENMLSNSVELCEKWCQMQFVESSEYASSDTHGRTFPLHYMHLPWVNWTAFRRFPDINSNHLTSLFYIMFDVTFLHHVWRHIYFVYLFIFIITEVRHSFCMFLNLIYIKSRSWC